MVGRRVYVEAALFVLLFGQWAAKIIAKENEKKKARTVTTVSCFTHICAS